MRRTRSRSLGQRLSHVPVGSLALTLRSPCFRPRLEVLEDRVQLGDTVLGLSAVALWEVGFTPWDTPWMLDPAAHHHRWQNDLFADLNTVGSQLLVDTGTDQVRSGTVGNGAGIGVTAAMADGSAPPIWASTDALAEHLAGYRLPGWDGLVVQAFPANPSPNGGGVGAPWLGSGVQFSSLSFAGIGDVASRSSGLFAAAEAASSSLRPANVSFDLSTGQLMIRANAGDHTVREAVTADGFVEVTLNGGQHSSNPRSAAFDSALAGATGSSLSQVRFEGAGGKNTLLVATQSLPHGLAVTAAGAEVVTQDVTVAGQLAIQAQDVTVRGTLRSEGLAVIASGWVSIDQAGRIESTQADGGGRIDLAANVFVNAGQVHADGQSGGQIVVQARNVLNAGLITADGTSPGADGGVVQLAFTDAYVGTAAAVTSARGAHGGSVVLDGGATGHLFSSGHHVAIGSVHGGTIDLLGHDIVLAAATVAASGEAGGGSIRIGGDLQGRNPAVSDAQTVTVTSATTVQADAEQVGAGGRVVVWSERETTFAGSVSVHGGSQAGPGGFAEVSGRGGLAYAGTADAAAPRGKSGTLLLDPKNLVIADAPAGVFPQFDLTDPHPTSGGTFGFGVTVLSSGNVVVTNPSDDFGGSRAGAAYLFNGLTGALVSSLVGSNPNDTLGDSIAGIIPLSNGNYVVESLDWNQGRGAATWGSATMGVSGTVSADNSLVGSNPGDYVGGVVNAYGNFIPGITPLGNGNYVVRSTFWNGKRGAATWGNGSTGTSGTVSAGNSLVGSMPGDMVSSYGVPLLSNGNYVVQSALWNGNRGAVTWGDGSKGTSGVVSALNSLVGSDPGDYVGNLFNALSNGNYVVSSSYWNGQRGASTWGDGRTGVSGTVSAANSLVGIYSGDGVGYYGITPLTNGNYVIPTPGWYGQRGAATWADGRIGITGTISEANSLIGGNSGDYAGRSVTALSNGNYVVDSPAWSRYRGAAAWGDGNTGTSGIISDDNSLIGSNPGDDVGTGGISLYSSSGIIPLSNGNYVVVSPNWNGQRGAVTWRNGSAASSDTVSAANSLVGSSFMDYVGSNLAIALSNGNYVVSSSNWNFGRGAATWGNGSTGITGTVSAANSLVGSVPGDYVSSQGVIPLNNGNYVVASAYWNQAYGAATWGNGDTGISGTVSIDNSFVGDDPGDQVGADLIIQLSNGNYVIPTPRWYGNRGAVTWGNGSTGIRGEVSADNSLVGSQPGDSVGTRSYSGYPYKGDIIALSNGNYVVASPSWNDNRGAVTWRNGSTQASGTVSADNSLVGSNPGDLIGNGRVIPLSNSNYVVASSSWNGQRGAATWLNGTSGRTLDGLNVITPQNSLVGRLANAQLGNVVENAADQSFLASFVQEGGGRITTGLADPSQLTYASGQAQDVTLTPGFLTRTLNTGTAVVLQASNDITVNSPILVNAGGHGGPLTLQAGRSIVLNAAITTDNGALMLVANDQRTNGVVDAQRDPGQAVITMAPGTTLNAGSGPLTVELRDGAGLTHRDSGAITLQTVSAGSVSVVNNGPSASGDVHLGSITTTGPQSYANPNSTATVTGNLTTANSAITFNHSVVLNAGLTLSVGSSTVNFAGGTVSPNPGIVTDAGGIVLTGSTTLNITLNGTDPGSYSRLRVSGPITLGGSTLNLVLGFEPPVGNSFEILTNARSESIRGTFNGLDEGAVFTQGGYQFQITYQGGTSGRSVVLTRLAPSPFLVTTTADSGPGSLRYVLSTAPQGSTIGFLSGLTGTITLTSGGLTIAKDETIAGPGAGMITISGNKAFEVFNIGPTVTATISGLTIANGSSALFGGGISNDGSLTVSNCTIQGNEAGNRGGGIYNSPSGTLLVGKSSLSGNSAPNAGDGIYNVGTLTVLSSTLSNNGGSGADGGGIYNVGTLALSSSTLAGNGDAGAFGGGVRNDGVLTVQQSTFAGNTGALGGAVYNVGTLIVSSSTISGNTAVGDGGGIDNIGGPLIARNTIVAGNTISLGFGPDLNGVLTSLGHNLIGNTSGASGFVASDLLNANPLLGPLQDNGGPTQTMAPLPGSPAVDAGDNTAAPAFDQRGPGFPRIVGGVIDIGAVEVQPGPVNSFQIDGPAQVTANAPFGVTVTALDAYGHTAVGYQGTVTFRSTDTSPGVILPANYTFTQADGGVHGFINGVTLRTVGSQTITVSDTLAAAISGSITIVVTPPTFLVTTVLDSGPGSLRQAILDADATPGLDTIRFAIGMGVQTINLASPLPAITQPVIIDGTTQPGYVSTPLIELNGAGAGPGADGLLIIAGGSVVRGLVINRFTLNGIELRNGGGNVIQGDYLGTDVTGTLALGNGRTGIAIFSSGNHVIGGTTPQARNIISGNGDVGILFFNSGNTGSQVLGNCIGLNASGTGPVPNAHNGIQIEGLSYNNLIGGSSPAAGNVISGNGKFGLSMLSGAAGNQVLGNYIGTDKTGTLAIGNADSGVQIRSPNNTIGGTVAGAGNVISGNGQAGIILPDSGASGIQILGNAIGTDASGMINLANASNGVQLVNTSGNTIGGTVVGAANVIAYNRHDGVLIDGGSGNAIQHNSIFGHNSGLGIELINGGNNQLPFPVLTLAMSAGNAITVSGLLQSTPNTTFALEFFANPVSNPSGFGEGKQFLGSSMVTTNNQGTATFSVTFTVGVPPGQFIAATATDPGNNTSAFSNCASVAGPPAPPPALAPGKHVAGIAETVVHGSSALPEPKTPIILGDSHQLLARRAVDVLFGKGRRMQLRSAPRGFRDELFSGSITDGMGSTT